MNRTVEADKKFKDGEHYGVIIEVEERTTPFQYVDFIIESEGMRIKAGYPDKITPSSQLGKLLINFGFSLKIDGVVNLKEIIGKTCRFMTMQNDKGYANVVKGSLKPNEEMIK